MARSNAKGAQREREWAARWGGKKVSRRGYEGHDVETPPLVLRKPLRLWEVKSKEALPTWFTDWLEQTFDKQAADGLAFRQNRKGWFVVVQAEQLGQSADSEIPQELLINGVRYSAVPE